MFPVSAVFASLYMAIIPLLLAKHIHDASEIVNLGFLVYGFCGVSGVWSCGGVAIIPLLLATHIPDASETAHPESPTCFP